TDIIKINTPAKTNAVLYYDNNPTKIAAVRTEYMGGKMFFMTFGFESLINPADRNMLMGKIYDWFNFAPPSDPVLTCADALAFGEIEAGKTFTKKLRLENTGDAELVISEAIITGGDKDQFKMIGTVAGSKIAVGDYKNVTISFVPTEEGSFTTVLTIISNSSGNSVKNVAITGSATPNGIDDYTGSGAELLTLSVGPNPFAVTTELTYTLNSTSSKHFDIVVIDASGREVISAFSGQVTPGTNEITLSAGNLAAGNYFITARTEGFNTQIPLIIIK
ncbi:MAG: choice-of-anchor D domain-containing protein, partial [Chlorobi bacterium]|nr:choice-of-anchor D domain-containing protein [Chlorobiota bacterium]